ncbi:MAG TPA: HAD family hydrolase [Candidatus Baltobacteraceae bacterium]|nr:HAD family hydrolase [Candidatus Baltobacteraceae bacterium]
MPAFIFDLDGTLVDTVYQHVVTWHTALRTNGFDLPMWRIHRKIGMSGQLLMSALELEVGRKIDKDSAKRLEDAHTQEMKKMRETVRVFAGVQDLFDALREADVPYAIASSGSKKDIGAFLEMLDLPDSVPTVTQEDAKNAKPDPQLFLKAAEKLGVKAEDAIVVGDSVWDMLAARRAHSLGVGLLTGGYAESEMTAAGAYRVYAEPADLRARLHEVGVNIKE